MNFANIKYRSKGVDNLGDNMQIIALDYLYSILDIKNIKYIEKDDLANYNGDKIILPIVMPLLDYVEGGLSNYFSRNIIPIFLAMTLVKDTLEDQEVVFLKKHSPVGCRDSRTKKTMERYGIKAFLTGCITSILPKRNPTACQLKTFIVDVDAEVIEKIPNKLLEISEIITHTRHNTINPKEQMADLYQRYLNEGKLVVTSLLHCAAPCVAAGVPVVIARKKTSYRFGWLDKFLPIYQETEWGDIDWEPELIDYENLKKDIINFYDLRLRNSSDFIDYAIRIDSFYESRISDEYYNDAFDPVIPKINKLFNQMEGKVEYSFWGMSQISIMADNYIQKEFPKAKLKSIYDSFKNLRYRNIQSKHPMEMENEVNEIVLVTSFSGHEAAINFFSKRPNKKYIICWERN